ITLPPRTTVLTDTFYPSGDHTSPIRCRVDTITMPVITILAFLVFMNHAGGALVLAQDTTTAYTSTLTTPIFVYLAQPSNTTIEAKSSKTFTTATESTPTTTAAEHYTIAPTLASISPTASTTNRTKNTTINDFGEPTSLSPEHPSWTIGATASLFCYDFLIMVAFAWCWVMGWFWWWKKVEGRNGLTDRGRERGREREWWGRMVMDENMEREMRRLGMV
ncbi:hypothetical protein BKA58DRAFT_462678, partial [Alternaria rosae]|uniref:uncharacterized protein n=1 Tax=Alternaria rosae TaxID=1187941 RepID=UPI001E8DB69C